MCNMSGPLLMSTPRSSISPPLSTTSSTTLVDAGTQTNNYWVESRHGTPGAENVIYYVHFPIQGRRQDHMAYQDVLWFLHRDLVANDFVLYRDVARCPRSGAMLMVENYQTEEVRQVAQRAVHEKMRLHGMACFCPRENEANGGVNCLLSNGLVVGVPRDEVTGVLPNEVNGHEGSQYLEKKQSVDESSSSDSDGDDDDAAAAAQLQDDVQAAADEASSYASDTDFYDSISEERSESAPPDDETNYLLCPYVC
ncbi:uncharacterized protein KD926_003675 [Aspergillus affinis]|uniref:uncharacterized protein n=1 Tax=Aspergillus affinis TaxID=1070780 RepID=UPI0022FEA4DC|nr:uncharacterized protein KD926_003675 [Aspergillus affinis]KAI9035375.1 hypothetical protein KD926_003675 [Aspergillus affinis]